MQVNNAEIGVQKIVVYLVKTTADIDAPPSLLVRSRTYSSATISVGEQ